ncbi:hypothetical protein [Flavobacterium sp. NRK1]|uniref:hypothetical protein n=1 Tax=Flavobacterium sp. NRK1 TaxID=2954929 RepID=UPI0020927CE6|nr:hypothetical protein [Flavobacterium sp. NRK1]MCO6147754.1 hypothetical protein [Flavobacterium sp. NRK1]
MGENTKRFLIFIAVLSLLLVLGDIFLWINISNQYSGTAAFKDAYLEKYPPSLRNSKGLSIIPIVLLTFASLVFIRASKSNVLKITGAVFAAILAIIIIWKMFTIF